MSTQGSDDARAALTHTEVLRAADELFTTARRYRRSGEYRQLLDFVKHFRGYSPYNAMLLHVQLPGATYVAPPRRWLRDYGRIVKPDSRPLVILQPMGPVMFVFDVSDTEPTADAKPLPRAVTHPFEVERGVLGWEFERTVWNAWRDGVQVSERTEGSQSAGMIRTAAPGRRFARGPDRRGVPSTELMELRYELLMNARHERVTQYATLVHELAHLYCGHVGTPNEKWWPERSWLARSMCELEAETVSYLVCERLGIDSPAAQYLADYLNSHPEVPEVSIETVLKAAQLVETMGRAELPMRKAEKN